MADLPAWVVAAGEALHDEPFNARDGNVSERLASTVIDALRSLPVELRMAAMGMRPTTLVRPGLGPAQDETFTYWTEADA